MNTELKKIEIIEHNWSDTSIVREGDTVCTLSIYDEATEETQDALEIIMSEDAKVIADALTTIQSCGLLPSQLLAENKDLKEWKESASIIMNNIDLQKVGKLINVRLGDDISSEILPFIEKTLKQRDIMIELVNTGDCWFYRNGHFKIEFVHQLQNLYHSLKGEELTIKE